jgi:hypothetical protein
MVECESVIMGEAVIGNKVGNDARMVVGVEWSIVVGVCPKFGEWVVVGEHVGSTAY